MRSEIQRRARFESIFHRHHREVRAYALRRGGQAHADDVVAETFLVAWRRLEDIGEDALPWLLGVARRVLANQHRGERRRVALLQQLLAINSSERVFAPPDTLGDDLAHALASLTPTEREALLLVAWEGLSPERAAGAAGCSPVAFRVRLHRARRRAARNLDGARAGHPTRTPSPEESR